MTEDTVLVQYSETLHIIISFQIVAKISFHFQFSHGFTPTLPFIYFQLRQFQSSSTDSSTMTETWSASRHCWSRSGRGYSQRSMDTAPLAALKVVGDAIPTDENQTVWH